jgi:hypothetical protein
MKSKVLSILIILCFCPVLLHAQIVSNYGIKTAFTKSILNTDDFPNFYTWRSGFNIAFYLEHDFYKYIALILQLEYSQKGYISEQVETNEIGTKIQDVRANTRLDYLSLPVFIKIKYPTQKLTPFIALGPRFDYLINNSKGRWKFTSVTVIDDFADHLKSFVTGSSISFGLQIPASQKYHFSIELRYNNDNTNSAKAPVQYIVKNSTYDIWIGFEF